MDKRCKDCRFWEKEGCYGRCNSEDIVTDTYMGYLRIKPLFGCIHWQEKEPDLRERLRRYMVTVITRCGSGCDMYAVEEAGMILAIVEKYQKGESDV